MTALHEDAAPVATGTAPRPAPRRGDPIPMDSTDPTIVTVTPELAATWLERNTRNRHIRKADVTALARLMAAGQFIFNGDAIRFDTDGNLLDGQHRLSAVIASGVTLPMLVIGGLPAEVQVTIDTGSRRSAGDALGLLGHQFANGQAAVARLALQVASGTVKKFRATPPEVVAYIDEHPEVLASVEFIAHVQNTSSWRDLAPAMASYTHMTFRSINKDDADDFYVALADLMPAYRGDPVIALGRRLADLRRTNVRLSEPTMMSLIYRTWNRRRRMEAAAKMAVSEVRSFADVPEPK